MQVSPEKISDLALALMSKEKQAAFTKPWEIRAFAIAVAATDSGEFEWSEFQEALTDAIKNWEAENPGYSPDQWSYYEHFVTALEVVLAKRERLSLTGLDERVTKILSMPAHHHHVARHDPIKIDPAMTVTN